MKKDRDTRRDMKKIRLFFQVLTAVLGVGIVGMWIYSAIMGASNQGGEKDKNVQVVIFDDIFSSFQNIFAGEVESQKESGINSDYDQILLQSSLAAGEKAIAIECKEQEEIKLLFAGDVLLDEHYAVMANLIDRGGNVEEAFSTELLNVMRSADVFMLNNEFTFTNRGTPTKGKQFTFRANPERVSLLQEMGVDVVSVANNHMYDYGEISLLDTLGTLNNAGIVYTGAGKDLEEAMRPVYLIANGMKIGIIGATQIERN